MVVQLVMYNFLEIQPLVKALSNRILQAMDTRNVADIRLRQTCSWPLVSFERGMYRVVGIPKYSCRGCSDHLYSSLLVVGNDSPLRCFKDLKGKTAAINELNSASGYLNVSYDIVIFSQEP